MLFEGMPDERKWYFTIFKVTWKVMISKYELLRDR